ncbi:MAG: LD-carboxypeptidase [Bacteroidales bacterium]|nr:LD-carboxypeptidase [Bacteroidales bacterium]
MITPEFLKPGDRVGIVSPARYVTEADIEDAISLIRSHGYDVVLGTYLFERHNQFGGTDEQRIQEFQNFLDDPSIKAIFCARGGYGSVRVINRLNWKKFLQRPKWIVGFSDITVFHAALHNKGIESLHAPMLFNLKEQNQLSESWEKTFEILRGEKPVYSCNSHPLNKEGRARGTLVGGNLSVWYSLRGTDFDFFTGGKILFIEDIDEYLYHIDRMMMNLKLGGKLDNIRGLIIGQMTDMKDNKVPFGKSAYEIISEYAADLNIPIAFGFPAGHENINLPLILGREILLEVDDMVKIQFR